MVKRTFLFMGIGISLILAWFALGNYRASLPIAEENLRGLALILTSAIENIAVRDPSLNTLAEFRPPDLAFFAIINRQGIYRFHSNPDLIGSPVADETYKEVFASKAISERRITLGTGERAYAFYTPLYLPGKIDVLRLTLHTYRADAVIRRAEYNMAVLFALLALGWVLGIILYRYATREERHRLDMAHRERLAQLGEMGAMLAHEIRNPLAGIKGFAQIIEKKPQEPRNAGFAHRIVAEVLRLETLVNDLLVYAGSDSTQHAPVPVCELIAYVLSLIRQEAAEQQVTLASDCREGLRVSGNRDRLGQLLLNLAKNALQAMPNDGSLRFAANISGKSVVLTVSDTGQGIDAETMTRIFEPFFTTKARGTGLGLALCKRIVEEHKGKIKVTSEAGKGTSFIVILPRG